MKCPGALALWNVAGLAHFPALKCLACGVINLQCKQNGCLAIGGSAMPRPAVLSQEKIAAAALAVIDRDGLLALTMRAVGRELGVAAMSLYNHVADRAELESLVAGSVVGGIDIAPRSADPIDEVKRLMRALRDALNAHPEAIPLFLARPTASDAAMAPLEALLAALHDAGFTEVALLRAFRTVFGFLMGFVQADLTVPTSSSRPAPLSQ